MGLSNTDLVPKNVSFADAYTAIRNWYQKNSQRNKASSEDYRRRSSELVKALPKAANLTDLEFRAVFGEVIYGNMEWGYHESDGKYKMAAWAHGALQTAGHSFSLKAQELAQLKTSVLWPYLSINRDTKA